MTDTALFSVERKGAKGDDPGAMPDLTEGESIKVRRKRLGWDQPELARRVGTSHSTIVRVEAGGSTTAMRLAVVSVLDKEEAKRGKSSDRIRHPGTRHSPPEKEGADVSRLEAARRSLSRAEVFLVEALEEVRRGLDALDEGTIERFRKSG